MRAGNIPVSAALVATFPTTLNGCSLYKRKDLPELARCVTTREVLQANKNVLKTGVWSLRSQGHCDGESVGSDK